MEKREKGGPMDSAVREALVGTPATNNARKCYAMETLISEVAELFPETTYEIAGIDGRNTALEVVFDISMLDTEDRERLLGVLMLTVHDPRVEEVLHDSDSVVVAFLSNPRLQDLRDTFDLSGAYGVLVGDL